jgi:BirA family biotin operon repressor/biotin-[acetyl-CoA-carboxylase] ligase
MLSTRRLGRSLTVVDECDSTMSLARDLALDEWEAGAVVLAIRQSAGRGRQGRRFVSPAGGLYLTVRMEPLEPVGESWRLGLVAALALREAVAASGGPLLELKWPNDLFLDRSKIAGTLCELVERSRGRTIVLVGLGANVCSSEQELALADAGPAGVLPPLEVREPLAALTCGLLERLERWNGRLREPEGWAAALESVLVAMRGSIGRPISLHRPDGSVIRGRCDGLRDDGALLVALPDGSVEAVLHAERKEF